MESLWLMESLWPRLFSAQRRERESSMTTPRTMANPAALKQFQADFEIARSAAGSAMSYLRFEDQHAASGAGMKRTWRAAVDCGAALKRMHEAKAYEDCGYADWTAVCRALKINRTVSYRLMAAAETLAGVNPSTIGKLSAPLSLRSIEDLAKLEPDEREQLLESAAEDPAILADIRKGMAETEAPKHTRANGIEYLLQQALRWFEVRGVAEQARTHLDALSALAAASVCDAA